MLTRRALLEGTLRGTSLLSVGTMVPGFLARAAQAASPGGDTVLVVLELNGGNDGLNTVIPYADDHYHKARPKIHLTREQVVRVDDHIGLNPGLRPFEKFLSAGQLAIIQGVGYPNPDRSHFESMDVWQTGDPTRKVGTGWLSRSVGQIPVAPGKIPAVHAGAEALPLALRGSTTGVPTIHPGKLLDLDLNLQGPIPPNNGFAGVGVFGGDPGNTPAGEDSHTAARRRLIEGLAHRDSEGGSPGAGVNPLLPFVQRSSTHAFASVEQLRSLAGGPRSGRQPQGFVNGRPDGSRLAENLDLVGRMIAAEFGTRLFYLSVSGFDTHANQLQSHQQLLGQVAGALQTFFNNLQQSGHARRVIVMTFSEFGRRVQENGTGGTDHGAASCQFLIGPGVAGGVVGDHPSLDPARLDAGDLRHHTDFRRVYATLLDGWLGCDSTVVLGSRFEPLPLLKSS